MIRRINRLANWAICLAVIVLAGATVRRFKAEEACAVPTPTPVNNRTEGRSLRHSLPGMDWHGNQRTLVLALSTRCHFCTQSAPFFKRLVAAAGSNVRVVVAMPQSAEVARRYLRRVGLNVGEVREVSLGAIGISGTPTLLLLDNAGVVTSSWVGMLAPEGEDQVLLALASR